MAREQAACILFTCPVKSSVTIYDPGQAAKTGGASGRMAREQAARLEERAAGEVLAGADVVAATCVGAGDARLAGRAFRLAVLDEACQATEPAALIALLQARAHALRASASLAPEYA